MITNYKYDPSGAGCQRFDAEEWADEWYFNAGDVQDEMARSGGNLGVVSIDGWEYFNPSGFE